MWLVTGLILGAGVLAGALWLRSRSVRIKWYEWLIVVTGILLVMFAVENARAFQAEFESTAASRSILVFGLPGLLLVLIAAALVFWRFARRARNARGRENAE